MLPAPATMAASPATRSSVSWNPAVPPPPVTGAAVGTWVTVSVGVGVGVVAAVAAVAVGVTVTVGVTVVVTVCVACGDTVEVGLVAPEGEVPGLLAGAVTVTAPLTHTVGEKLGMVGAVDDDELHAAGATGASRASAPQHSAVSLAPSVVPRTFMGPPHAPGR